MPKHIKSILGAAAENMDGIAETPEANNMFTVREYGDTLTGMQADLFRTLVAKILFLLFRSRPYLNTTLAFLTARVHNPDGYEYKNLARTIRHIRAT